MSSQRQREEPSWWLDAISWWGTREEKAAGVASPVRLFFRALAMPHSPPSAAEKVKAVITMLVVAALVSAALALPAASMVGGLARGSLNYWDQLPVDIPDTDVVPTRTVLTDANGEVFAQFYSQNRVPVSLDEVSPHFIDALLAVEDDRFYDHGGVDFKALARAIAHNAAHETRQGGSTLTQQLVENIRLADASSEQEVAEARAGSLTGKLQEAKYAVELEQAYTKDELLEMYINTVYFGSGAYGIATASQRFFSVGPGELTLTQAATLAGLLRNPSGYDPLTNPEEAEARRNVVLGRMLTTGRITADEHQAAVAQPLETDPGEFDNGCYDSDYPLYCSYVQAQILQDPTFGQTPEDRSQRLYLGGMEIRTALQPHEVRAAEQAVADALGAENRVTGSVAIVEPGTGHVTAIAQNRPFGLGEGQTEVVYATSRRQTGSTFKAITLATAFEQGVSPSLRLSSSARYQPTGVDAPPGGFTNHLGREYGVQDAYGATRVSSNTWYVRLTERVGVREVASMAGRLGLAGVPRDLTGREASITLGAYDSSPLEVASAYATFASGGIYCPPTPIVQVTDTRSGQELPRKGHECRRELMPAVAASMNDLLVEPFKEGGTAEGLSLTVPSAGKTGTTNQWSDAWFAGYTTARSAAVWMGDPRGSAYPLQNVWAMGRHHHSIGGGTVPAPVWRGVMEEIHEDLETTSFTQPSSSLMTLRSGSLPNTRGLDLAAAVTALHGAGVEDIDIAAEAADLPDAPPGTVTRQRVDGTHVTLSVSEGTDDAVFGASVVMDEAGQISFEAREETS